MRVLINSDGYVTSPTFTNDTGEAADLDTEPTCEVAREDGTALTAAVVDDPTAADGKYRAKLLAAVHTGTLDWLTLTWTGTMTGVGTIVLTQQVDVVGGFYLSVPDMRAIPGLSSTTDFSAAKLRDTCSEFEDIAEKYTGTAWVPRYNREMLAGRGGYYELLEQLNLRTIVSASSTDTNGVVTPFVIANWTVDRLGRLITDGDTLTQSALGERNLTVRYTHGLDWPPEELKRAARIWIPAQLLADRSQVGRKVLTETNPDGYTYRFGTADWSNGRPTGIEDVDQILNSLGRPSARIL